MIQAQAEIEGLVTESLGEFAIKDPRYKATDCVAIRMWSPEGVMASNKTKELIETGNSSESSSGNTIEKDTSQGTTGSDDF